jgi:hypothetical protein
MLVPAAGRTVAAESACRLLASFGEISQWYLAIVGTDIALSDVSESTARALYTRISALIKSAAEEVVTLNVIFITSVRGARGRSTTQPSSTVYRWKGRITPGSRLMWATNGSGPPKARKDQHQRTPAQLAPSWPKKKKLIAMDDRAGAAGNAVTEAGPPKLRQRHDRK